MLDTIMRLQAEAAGSKNGSKVVALLGNHEHMVIGRNTEYMSSASEATFEASGGATKLMARDGKYGKWIRALPLLYIDLRTVFVHGFLDPCFVDPKTGFDQKWLEKYWRTQMNELDHDKKRTERRPERPVTDIFWDRPWVGDAEMRREEELKLRRTLEVLDADRMVVGHTPCLVPKIHDDGILLMMDQATSRWMCNGKPHVVELTAVGEEAEALLPDDGQVVVHQKVKKGVRVRVIKIPVVPKLTRK